jgi:predicted NBD/HSP70 family sugar kinase
MQKGADRLTARTVPRVGGFGHGSLAQEREGKMTARLDEGADADHLDSVITVLDLVRSGAAHTKPGIAQLSGLGRNVVTRRVNQLLDAGLLEGNGFAESSGGRSPRELRFQTDAGHVLVADLGARAVSVACADLAGGLVAQRQEPCDVKAGPRAVLDRISELFDEVLGEHPCEVWGVGIGVPGPVDFVSGRTIAPPIMPGWDGYDIRGHLATRFHAPVWVDNDVNLMVLGELRGGLARGEKDVVFVKVGTGIGAGLVSGGRLHRGAQGSAGDIGHVLVVPDSDVVCRCGLVGCLEAVAGGGALVRDGRAAGLEGRSPFLAAVVAQGREVTLRDVSEAMNHGDPVARDLMTTSAQLVGETLARIVNFINPALVVLGGAVPDNGDIYLTKVRQVVLSRSLPLATRHLRLERSPRGTHPALTGGAFMVVDELFSRERLGRWIGHQTPAGRPELVS